MRTVITDNGPRPQLKYFDGATCPEDKTQELATQIDFRCDPRAGKVSGFHSFLLGDHRIHIFMFFFFSFDWIFRYSKGTPILTGFLENCTHLVDWATNVICKPFEANLDEKTCEIHNSQLNKTLDLTSIFDDGKFKV